MRRDIIKTPELLEILAKYEFLQKKSKADFISNLPSLSPYKISHICAAVWGCPNSDFFGKVDHTKEIEVIKKKIFLSACFYYSNTSVTELASIVGCTPTLVKNSTSTFLFKIKYSESKYGEFASNVAITLNRECPGRLDALYPVQKKSFQDRLNDHYERVTEACSAPYNPSKFHMIVIEQRDLVNELCEQTSRLYLATIDAIPKVKP